MFGRKNNKTNDEMLAEYFDTKKSKIFAIINMMLSIGLDGINRSERFVIPLMKYNVDLKLINNSIQCKLYYGIENNKKFVMDERDLIDKILVEEWKVDISENEAKLLNCSLNNIDPAHKHIALKKISRIYNELHDEILFYLSAYYMNKRE